MRQSSKFLMMCFLTLSGLHLSAASDDFGNEDENLNSLPSDQNNPEVGNSDITPSQKKQGFSGVTRKANPQMGDSILNPRRIPIEMSNYRNQHNQQNPNIIDNYRDDDAMNANNPSVDEMNPDSDSIPLQNMPDPEKRGKLRGLLHKGKNVALSSGHAAKTFGKQTPSILKETGKGVLKGGVRGAASPALVGGVGGGLAGGAMGGKSGQMGGAAVGFVGGTVASVPLAPVTAPVGAAGYGGYKAVTTTASGFKNAIRAGKERYQERKNNNNNNRPQQSSENQDELLGAE